MVDEDIVKKLADLLGEDRFSELADSIEESVSELCAALVYEVSPMSALDKVEESVLKCVELIVKNNLTGIMVDLLAD